MGVISWISMHPIKLKHVLYDVLHSFVCYLSGFQCVCRWYVSNPSACVTHQMCVLSLFLSVVVVFKWNPIAFAVRMHTKHIKWMLLIQIQYTIWKKESFFKSLLQKHYSQRPSLGFRSIYDRFSDCVYFFEQNGNHFFKVLVQIH